jgi:hypothetical protein
MLPEDRIKGRFITNPQKDGAGNWLTGRSTSKARTQSIIARASGSGEGASRDRATTISIPLDRYLLIATSL